VGRAMGDGGGCGGRTAIGGTVEDTADINGGSIASSRTPQRLDGMARVSPWWGRRGRAHTTHVALPAGYDRLLAQYHHHMSANRCGCLAPPMEELTK